MSEFFGYRGKVLNMTPHAITVRVDGQDTTVPPCGRLVRCATTEMALGRFGGRGPQLIRSVLGNPVIPVTDDDWTDLGDGTYPVPPVVIVSLPVMGMLHRIAGKVSECSFLCPDTGPTAVRDDAGRIVAVTRMLAR